MTDIDLRGYYEESYPPSIYGPPPQPIAATGATAGTPGTFTPAGATPPANLAAMAGIVATPATAWTTGQRVVMGDANQVYWDGAAWSPGVGTVAASDEGSEDPDPIVVDIVPDPSTMTVAEVVAYAEAHPQHAQALLDAERAGKNRSTLVTELDRICGIV